MKAAVLGIGGMGTGVARSLRCYEGISGTIAYDVRENVFDGLSDLPDMETTTDLNRVLNDPQIELVYITAPNDQHFQLAIAAMRAGKAVMCEKPMALNFADSAKMCEVAEKHNAWLQIGFELRYSKLYLQVKQWIEAGVLGDVVSVHCDYICDEFHGKNSWRNQSETAGSMFGEKLSHYVDLPRWWIGSKVQSVYSVCAPNVVSYKQVHDNYHTTYRFENGAVSSLHFSMYAAQTGDGDTLQQTAARENGGHELKYLISGTRGAIATDVFARTARRWEFSDSPTRLQSTLVETKTWQPDEDEAYFHNTYAQNEDIARRVHCGLAPSTPARDALETMKLVFAAERSADENRVVQLSEFDSIQTDHDKDNLWKKR